MVGLTIGEVARRSGLRTSALRYYEAIGLLPAARRVNGQRRYEASALEQLAIVQQARAAGFTIAEIQTLVNGFAPDTPPPARWRALAEQKLPEVAAQLAALQGMQRILQTGLACECLTLTDCARLLVDAGSGR